MKKMFICLICLLLVSCSREEEVVEVCELDGTQVCYDEETNAILIEDKATIRIGGLERAFEEALIELWNQKYPEYSGLIVASEEPYDAITDFLSKNSNYDIVYTTEELATYYLDKLRPIEDLITSKVKETSGVETMVGSIQQFFVPYSMEGVTFVYNKTMLEALGVDVETDENGDRLPDSFDTWEEIFVLADTWGQTPPTYKNKEVLITFPFALNEMSMSYFMLTSNGFRLFPENVGNQPGYDRDTFTKALWFVKEIGNHPFAVKKVSTKNGKDVTVSYVPYEASEYIWQWEKTLTQELAPFGLIASWMSLDEAVSHTEAVYVPSPFPTYQDSKQASMITYKGFAMKKTTEYPSAANAVMEFLRSNEVMQLFATKASELPYLYNDHSLVFEDTLKENWTYALRQGDHISLLALPENVYTSAINGYYEIEWKDLLIRLVDQQISPKQMASTISQRYEKWYEDKSKIDELEDEIK